MPIQYHDPTPMGRFIHHSAARLSRIMGQKLGDRYFQKNNRAFRIPGVIQRRYTLHDRIILDHNAVTLEPLADAATHLLFFHGGGYVIRGSRNHWMMLDTLIRDHNHRATYVDYPLAPKYSYLDTHAMVMATYQQLVQDYPQDAFIFIGDSAGGGLALAFAQTIFQQEILPHPKQLILISPWLDMTMAHPGIHDVVDQDCMLSIQALQGAAASYAKGDPLTEYPLSPIYGSLEGLCPIQLFVSTHELFYPECMTLNDRIQELGGSIETHIYRDLPHDWVSMPFTEADTALGQIKQFIQTSL